MTNKDEHIVLLNWNIKGLNKDLNEAFQIVERVFTFGFNITAGQAKYFFLDYGVNFDHFEPSKFMDKIMVSANGVAINYTKEMVDYFIEIDIDLLNNMDKAPCDLNPLFA